MPKLMEKGKHSAMNLNALLHIELPHIFKEKYQFQ
jgi:hypothetical protein